MSSLPSRFDLNTILSYNLGVKVVLLFQKMKICGLTLNLDRLSDNFRHERVSLFSFFGSVGI